MKHTHFKLVQFLPFNHCEFTAKYKCQNITFTFITDDITVTLITSSLVIYKQCSHGNRQATSHQYLSLSII